MNDLLSCLSLRHMPPSRTTAFGWRLFRPSRAHLSGLQLAFFFPGNGVIPCGPLQRRFFICLVSSALTVSFSFPRISSQRDNVSRGLWDFD